jgi:hypothetical protein
MNQEKYVFAQLVEFLNNNKFRRLVEKYDGNRYVKHFTCWNQLLAMMFCQLSNRESLRDLIVALDTHQGKRIIWDWVVNPSPKQHLHQPIKIGIIGSSKTSLSI